MDLYVSTDIEADGPCPGKNSMLSFGSAVFDGDSEEPLERFSVNLETLHYAVADPDTMLFWKRNQKAYDQTRINPEHPVDAMKDYARWLKGLGGKPIFVGYPAAFDSLFVFWYLHMFAGENPFGWQALDIKSYAMAVLGGAFSRTVKGAFPPKWFGPAPHTHVALDDAIEQGVLFTRILKQNMREIRLRDDRG